MNQFSTRSVAPLAALTAVAMLATDLFLPAVPFLPTTLGGTIEQAQYTLSGFLAALAIGQLFWGWTSDRFGESWTIVVGTSLLILAGFACALAPNIEFLIIARILQGLGAGAPTVAVPALIRKKFSETDSVKAIGTVASIEAIVPALGPVLGAGIIYLSGWRMSFTLLAGLTLLISPFLLKVVRDHRSEHKTVPSSYFPLFKNLGFLRFASSYAIMFGALIVMVMSAPQLIVSWFQLDVYYFSIMQIAGVASFIFFVQTGNKLVESKGMDYVIRIGSLCQFFACVGFLALGLFSLQSFVLLTVFWVFFGAGLALRAPAIFTRSLSFAGAMAGKASGLLMFFAFGACSLATTIIAHFLEQGFLPLASLMFGMTIISTLLSVKIGTRESARQ